MDGDQLLGILSERDYARKIELEGRCSKDTKVGEIMTGGPVCVPPHRTVEEAMAVMTDKRVRHLPVIEGQRVVGLISIGDVVKHIISQQEFIIEQLENYITGTPVRPR
jgi:CBS domain-containing protein